MSKFNYAESTGPDNAVGLDNSKLTGLCLTCNFAQDCVRAEHSGQPVWFCEEFSDYTPQTSRATGASWKVIDDTDVLHSHKQDTARTLGGLCVNCATRESCTLSETDTDIWECNEYS